MVLASLFDDPGIPDYLRPLSDSELERSELGDKCDDQWNVYERREIAYRRGQCMHT